MLLDLHRAEPTPAQTILKRLRDAFWDFVGGHYVPAIPPSTVGAVATATAAPAAGGDSGVGDSGAGVGAVATATAAPVAGGDSGVGDSGAGVSGGAYVDGQEGAFGGAFGTRRRDVTLLTAAHFFTIVPLHETKQRQLLYLQKSRELLRECKLLP